MVLSKKTRTISLMMTTAIVGVALAGTSTSAAPSAESYFNKAQKALNKGQVDKAISNAEAAVQVEPHNSSFRALLGAAYLEAGRFDSAATSFGDALELGDSDARTVLSYVLAKVAQGDNSSALRALSEYSASINPTDMGLALALAGQPERGVHVLTNAVRSGDTSSKARQNLAYTYALAGNWRAARVMAAEDVSADKLDERISEWASTSRREDYQVRVARLLGVTPTSDNGQPSHLALADYPSAERLAASSAAKAAADNAAARGAASAQVAGAEQDVAEAFAFADSPTNLEPAVATQKTPVMEPVAGPTEVVASTLNAMPVAEPAPKPVAAAPIRFVSKEVVQPIPAKAKEETKQPNRVASSNTQRRMAIATGSAATHMVQLGAFDSREVAEAKWKEMQRKYTGLKGRDGVITEAKVDGRTYFRVAAGGFSKKSARSMCSTVKSSGRGCFAYAAATPPAGVVDRKVRVASRGR